MYSPLSPNMDKLSLGSAGQGGFGNGPQPSPWAARLIIKISLLPNRCLRHWLETEQRLGSGLLNPACKTQRSLTAEPPGPLSSVSCSTLWKVEAGCLPKADSTTKTGQDRTKSVCAKLDPSAGFSRTFPLSVVLNITPTGGHRTC